MTVQLFANSLSFSYGADRLIDDLTVRIGPGDRVGLVGPNGCGKSTLLGLLAGHIRSTQGTVELTPSSATIGLMNQRRDGQMARSVAELIQHQTGVAQAQQDLDNSLVGLASSTPGADTEYDIALNRWLALGGADLEDRSGQALAVLGVADLLERGLDSLSGGQRAKVWLAALQLSQFDVLLLDEPTNDLDTDGIDLLEHRVLDHAGPMVLVSHDRRFLDAVVTDVIEFNPDPRQSAASNVSFFGGGWASYTAERDVRRQRAENEFEAYMNERDRLGARAQTTREWSAKGVARERRPPDNDRAARGARIEASEQLASKARQSERALERLEQVDKPWQPWRLSFSIGAVERSGDLVARLDAAVVRRADFKLGPITLEIGAGQRVLLEGPNGSGKTTLLNALFAGIPLESGENRIGRSVVLGRLGQERQDLAGPGRAVDFFVDQTDLDHPSARAALAKFGLSADHVSRPSSELSPGEQTRVVLAVFQAKGVNTLVLDEPTNHLDLEAIEQLEQALSQFSGTLLVISHDRVFIEAVEITDRYELGGGLLLP